MKVGITGVSGFIGSRVAARCGARGIEVVGFSRNPGADARRFELTSAPDISGLDAIVNLAGEPILGLWTKEKKRRIHERAAFWEHGASWKLSPRRPAARCVGQCFCDRLLW